jgi:hypothetical protein
MRSKYGGGLLFMPILLLCLETLLEPPQAGKSIRLGGLERIVVSIPRIAWSYKTVSILLLAEERE